MVAKTEGRQFEFRQCIQRPYALTLSYEQREWFMES